MNFSWGDENKCLLPQDGAPVTDVDKPGSLLDLQSMSDPEKSVSAGSFPIAVSVESRSVNLTLSMAPLRPEVTCN